MTPRIKRVRLSEPGENTFEENVAARVNRLSARSWRGSLTSDDEEWLIEKIVALTGTTGRVQVYPNTGDVRIEKDPGAGRYGLIAIPKDVTRARDEGWLNHHLRAQRVRFYDADLDESLLYGSPRKNRR